MKERAPSLTLTLLKRELLTGLRSWKSFLLLLALLGLLYSTAFYAMNAASINYIFMSGAMRSLFSMQVFGVGAIVFAAIPAMAAVSINGERQDDNYDLLLTTLITPRRIVLGKFAAVLIRALLIATAVLPFTGVVYFYAGVDVESFFGALAVLVPAALCNTAVGLWCSNAAPRPARSIFLTFGIIGLMAGLIPASAGLYYNVAALNQIALFDPLATAIARHPFEAYVLYQLLIGAFFLLATLFPLRDVLNSTRVQRRAASLARITPLAVSTRVSKIPLVTFPDGANPLGYKDLCGSSFLKPSVALAAFIVTASAYGLLFYWMVSVSTELIMTIGMLERVFLLVLVPPMVAVLMVKEREEIAFDMLRVTLLNCGTLIGGKLLVLMRLLKPILFAIMLCKTLVMFRVMNLIDTSQLHMPGYVVVLDLVLLPLHVLFAALASMAGAALPRKLIPAIGGALGFTLLATFVLLFVQTMLSSDPIMGEREFAFYFLASHLQMIGIGLGVSLGVTFWILTSLWNDQGDDQDNPNLPEHPRFSPQPPSFPK